MVAQSFAAPCHWEVHANEGRNIYVQPWKTEVLIILEYYVNYITYVYLCSPWSQSHVLPLVRKKVGP